MATHLVRAFHDAGAEVVQVCARTPEHARQLAESVGAEAITDPGKADPSVDFCIVCVGDSAVADVARRLPLMHGIVVHTSGSVEMDVLRCASARVGVLYPLQTFSRERSLDVSRVPFFTEGSDADVLAAIDALASLVCGSVAQADSAHRQYLHVAGVLGCNFPNYLIGCAIDMLAAAGYGAEVLRPLVEETVAKVFDAGATAAQTGPARRGDVATIEKHRAMLPEGEACIYDMLSRAIMAKYNNGNEQN